MRHTSLVVHQAFRLFAHSWYPRLTPLLLTWFISLPGSGHQPSVEMRTGWLSSCYTCSYRFKGFCELIQLSVIYGACSILHPTPLMDFRTFDPICPKKAQYGVLFLSEWNVYIADLIAHCLLTEQLNAARRATRHPMRTRSVVCNFNIAFTLWFILVYIPPLRNMLSL